MNGSESTNRHEVENDVYKQNAMGGDSEIHNAIEENKKTAEKYILSCATVKKSTPPSTDNDMFLADSGDVSAQTIAANEIVSADGTQMNREHYSDSYGFGRNIEKIRFTTRQKKMLCRKLGYVVVTAPQKMYYYSVAARTDKEYHFSGYSGTVSKDSISLHETYGMRYVTYYHPELTSKMFDVGGAYRLVKPENKDKVCRLQTQIGKNIDSYDYVSGNSPKINKMTQKKMSGFLSFVMRYLLPVIEIALSIFVLCTCFDYYNNFFAHYPLPGRFNSSFFTSLTRTTLGRLAVVAYPVAVISEILREKFDYFARCHSRAVGFGKERVATTVILIVELSACLLCFVSAALGINGAMYAFFAIAVVCIPVMFISRSLLSPSDDFYKSATKHVETISGYIKSGQYDADCKAVKELIELTVSEPEIVEIDSKGKVKSVRR